MTARDAAAPLPSTFSLRVLARMAALGLTKRALAERAGLSRQTLENVLQGSAAIDANMPSVRTLLGLATALKVHPYWLTEALCVDQRVSMHLTSLMQGDRAGFVADVSAPDGCVVAPGTHFYKTWTAHKLGVVSWAGRRVQCWDNQLEARVQRVDGTPFDGSLQRLVPDVQAMDMGDVVDGQVGSFTVGFTAPSTPGPAFSYWLMTDAEGLPCISESIGMAVIVNVVAEADALAHGPRVLADTDYRPARLAVYPA